jgi:tripartite motif-containing protein 71
MALACLILLAAAVPVMADPTEPEPPAAAGEPVLQASEYSVPTSAEIAAMHQKIVHEEEQRAQELEEAPFVAQREASRDAYAEEDPAEAEELLRSTFGEALGELNNEPGRALSDSKLDRNLDHGAALVTVDGRNEILQTGQPIETENDEGDMGKVDLSLEHGPEGIEPENPLVDVTIGETADEGVEIGEEGLTVTQVGAEESKGRLLGDKNVFFGEVEEGSDTDLMVSPTSRGVELFDMLRSVDSPEKLRFHVEIPDGDTLKPEPGGGAEIVDSEDKVVDLIDKPHGEDAQGTYVPVDLEVEGDSVVLNTNHREEDLAYPILIDPEFENEQWDVWQNWGFWSIGQNLQGLGYWHFESVGSGVEGRQSDPAWAGQPGLYTAVKAWEAQPGWRGTYYLNTPNTNVYLRNVEINPFSRNDESCGGALYPYDYAGYRDTVQNVWNGVWTNDAASRGWFHREGWGHQFDFGLEVDGETGNTCWRSLRAGGINFYMGEWSAPSMLSATSSVPSGWINGSTPFSIHVHATDPGLGVKEFGFAPSTANPGNPVPKQVGCVGTYESPCPTNVETAFSFTGAEFPKGEDNLAVNATSPTEKRSPTSIPLNIKVDTEPPVVHLGGQLQAAIQEGEGQSGDHQGQGGPELTQPVYNLEVEAKDGIEGTSNVKEKRSGVKTIEVSVTDATGTKVESTKAFPNPKAPCSLGSCEEKVTYSIPMTGLTAGKHHIIVKASDFAGNKPTELVREFEYFPATGLTEEDVTQRFLLADGEEHGEGSYQGPELAVNVMNGNVVYHQRDVEVEGPTTNLEVELFYNSQLPKPESSEFGTGWTLSQTPSLEPASSGNMATALTAESQLTGNVELPQKAGEGEFSDKLGAYIEKEPSGGYVVSEDGGEEAPATVYDSKGKAMEVQTSPTASVEYGYEGEHLSEIAVNDVGSTDVPPPSVKEAPTVVPNYVSSFGSAGTGNGQLSHPADVALDSKGDEWVADSGNNRVEEFTPAGVFMKSLGSIGTGNGQFSSPESLSFDAAGDLWVADKGNDRIEEFGPTGTFVRAVGTKGFGTGQFERPDGITVAPDGHVLVADAGGERIVELSAAGAWIKTIATPGSSFEPRGIGVGPDGEIWAGEGERDELVEFSPSGELIRRIRSLGTSAYPDAVAVGALGEVWVGDPGNQRVLELTKEGSYITQFGSAGTGAGQFALAHPMGITTDNDGDLYVTDPGNNRVEHWETDEVFAAYMTSFGTTGTGAGQLKLPGDLAVDGLGHLWVPDIENNRVEEFSREGKMLAQIGAAGTGNGQFHGPRAITFLPDGDFWVVDSGNNRLEEFNGNAEFIKAVGSKGAGPGQFNGPAAIAVAPTGNLWVADRLNARLVELDENGNFIKAVSPPELEEPDGIAFGPGGDAWVSDYEADRVFEINPAGEILREFGSGGSQPGHLSHPGALTVDEGGLIDVVDLNNERVEVFSGTGEYISQVGTSGAGPGQFAFQHQGGIVADERGDLWIADSQNNRIQEWKWGPSGSPSEEETVPSNDDPSVEVKTSAGLVSTVVGPESGNHHYVHSGELLTSDEGPGGTTKYEYEAPARLKKVTLPNGTVATVKYEAMGRATEVVVDPAGEAGPKWTKFTYLQEIAKTVAENHKVPLGSREVTVEPQEGDRTFYAIDAAGDVLKSWNVEVAPSIFGENGTLTQASKEKAIDGNDTQELEIKAFAPEGIRTIQFVVNGSTIVDEKTCTGTATECEFATLQWIVEPEDLPAGTMWIEVVITGRVLDEKGQPRRSSTRWWVTVPYVPPPEPGIPHSPKYKEVLNFREEYGLDLDLNPVADELALHSRVWETIDAWWNPGTEAGQVANATWERWGVPLRYVDEQELEYREWLYRTNAEKIDKWLEETEPANFAGYYLDNRAGGIMYVGFLGDQEQQLNQLKASLNLVAPDRVKVYPVPPTVSYLTARAAIPSITETIQSNPVLREFVVDIREEEGGGGLRIGTPEVAKVNRLLHETMPGAPVSAVFEAAGGHALSGRFRNTGRMRAGDAIFTFLPGHGTYDCTAGFGAKEQTGTLRGQPTWSLFTLTAGHCRLLESLPQFYRSTEVRPQEGHEDTWRGIGSMRRDAWAEGGVVRTDAGAIETNTPDLVPQGIFGEGGVLLPTRSAETAKVGDTLCYSGAETRTPSCGPVVARSVDWHNPLGESEPDRGGYWVKFSIPAVQGDSGSPVYTPFHHGVGLVTSCRPANCSETLIEPLLHPPHMPSGTVPGILDNPNLGQLSLKLGE